MKRLISLFARLSSKLSPKNTSVTVERFKDRGIDWVKTAPTGSSESKPPPEASTERFNDRGTDWITEAPTGSEKPRKSVAVKPSRFNS